MNKNCLVAILVVVQFAWCTYARPSPQEIEADIDDDIGIAVDLETLKSYADGTWKEKYDDNYEGYDVKQKHNCDEHDSNDGCHYNRESSVGSDAFGHKSKSKAVNDDQMEEDEDVSNDQQDELGGGDGDGEGYHSEEEDMQCDGEDDQDMELVENLEDDSSEESRVAVEFEVRKFMEKSDEELFKSELEVPSCVEQSAKFKERKRKFIETYMEEQDFQNSQEILEAFSQAPPVVEDCLKQRLSHLTKQEKATRLIVKTLSDTIQRLKETPGAEARKQVQVILAAATHHRFN